MDILYPVDEVFAALVGTNACEAMRESLEHNYLTEDQFGDVMVLLNEV